ncbi:hypothetical protein [Tepidibacillus marianensis]|uniref:hypothetical protein n=1 Tax=Tepidibacillus marianensis TaxID=3131995 RepID=UPI0030D037EB
MKRNNKSWMNRVLLTTIGLLVIFGSIAFAEEDGGVVTQKNPKDNNASSWQPQGHGMGRYFSGKMRATHREDPQYDRGTGLFRTVKR